MIKVQISLNLIPHEDYPDAPRNVHRVIDRNWAGIPRAGDVVSLGGGDAWVVPVTMVAWLDGTVVLHCDAPELTAADAHELALLGFEPTAD